MAIGEIGKRTHKLRASYKISPPCPACSVLEQFWIGMLYSYPKRNRITARMLELFDSMFAEMHGGKAECDMLPLPRSRRKPNREAHNDNAG